MSLVYQANAASGNNLRSGLYIGAKEDARDQDKLARWRITHVLNVTPAKQANVQAGVPNYFEKKFVYKRIAVLDNRTSATDFLSHADAIVDFISTGLCHGSVLVHCQRGVSRSTTAVLFYLLRRAEMSLTDALAMIQRRRPQAQPIPAFLEILGTFEGTCMPSTVDTTTAKYAASAKRTMIVGPAMPAKRARVIGPSLGPSSSQAKDGDMSGKTT